MSFNRSGYIGRAPGDSAITIAKQYFQPSAIGKTFTFSAGYSPGLIDVYRNGIKLINVLDYAATDGSTIVLDTPVGVGSTVQVVAYKAYNVATVKATELDTTVTGTNLNLNGTLDVASLTTTVDINVSGGATVGGTLVANAFSGDGSALTGVASTDNIITGTAATFTDTAVNAGVPNVNIVGLATAGIITAYGDVAVGSAITMYASSGIVSATEFYGDGSNLEGVVSGVELQLSGTTVGTSVTVLNFGAGISSVTPVSSGISTIETSRILTIGVRTGAAVTFAITGTSFNVSSRSGNVAINV